MRQQTKKTMKSDWRKMTMKELEKSVANDHHKATFVAYGFGESVPKGWEKDKCGRAVKHFGGEGEED